MKKIVIFVLILGLVWYVWPDSKYEVKNVGNANHAIVVLGDSLSYGKGAPAEGSYPALLEKSLNRSVINMGLNGDTAVNAKQRVKTALDYHPYMVLIEFGGNDFMRGVAFNSTLEAIEEMIDAVQAAGAVAVLVDTGGNYVMGKYSKAYKKLARQKGAVFVPGILDGIMGKRELMSDQVHPNAAGYKMIAAKVEKAITPYLK